MLAKAEQQDQNSDHPSPPKMNRYTEFIEMEEEKISTEFIKKSCHSVNKSTLPRFVNTYISNIKHIVLLYLCMISEHSLKTAMKSMRILRVKEPFCQVYTMDG